MTDPFEPCNDCGLVALRVGPYWYCDTCIRQRWESGRQRRAEIEAEAAPLLAFFCAAPKQLTLGELAP